MKKMHLHIFIFLLCMGCISTPEVKELTLETNEKLHIIKSYLKAEEIEYGYTRKKSTSKGDNLFFSLSIYNVDNYNADLDSLNLVIMNQFEKNGFTLNKCKRISFFYYKNYNKAKLVKGFYYDKDKKLTEIFYR